MVIYINNYRKSVNFVLMRFASNELYNCNV